MEGDTERGLDRYPAQAAGEERQRRRRPVSWRWGAGVRSQVGSSLAGIASRLGSHQPFEDGEDQLGREVVWLKLKQFRRQTKVAIVMGPQGRARPWRRVRGTDELYCVLKNSSVRHTRAAARNKMAMGKMSSKTAGGLLGKLLEEHRSGAGAVL